jgi:hypothetical protein
MSLPGVVDLYVHGSCQWTPVFLRFVDMYLDTIQWGLMQQQSRHYCHTILCCLTLNDSKGDYQDHAKAEGSVVIILKYIFNYNIYDHVHFRSFKLCVRSLRATTITTLQPRATSCMLPWNLCVQSSGMTSVHANTNLIS